MRGKAILFFVVVLLCGAGVTPAWSAAGHRPAGESSGWEYFAGGTPATHNAGETRAARNSFEVRFIIGKSAFLDEDTPFDHTIFGAAFAIGITEHLRIEPQFLYMDGPGPDEDFTITGNIAYDLIQSERLDFYIIGGAGLINQRDRIGDGPAFSSSEGTASGGAGVKIKFTDRLFVAPEFRLGYEPLYLFTVSLGYKF